MFSDFMRVTFTGDVGCIHQMYGNDERLRIGFFNYTGRKKAERFLEEYFLTDFQYVDWLFKTHNWCSCSKTHAILWYKQDSFFFVCVRSYQLNLS